MSENLIPAYPTAPPTYITGVLQQIALDRFNNYLTDEKFADDYGLTITEAKDLIRLSTSVHERVVEEFRGKKLLS
jgi:hypothetical protein